MSTASEIDDIIPHDRTRVADKWGLVAEAGYLATPYVLLLNQKKLGLKSDDLNVLLNILAHWHAAERLPFPHSITIAKRMGVSQRTVQRCLTRLKKGGFLKKLKKRHRADPVAYDPRPLVEKLRPYAEARIRIAEPVDFETALDEATLRALSPRAVPRAAEMFADVIVTLEGEAETKTVF